MSEYKYQIDEEKKKIVLESFGRTETTAKEDIKTIKEWIKTQPHLPEIMEDVKIENFLIENKFSVEKTKCKIDRYYTIRSIIPDFFQGSNPKTEQMKRLMETAYCCTHPDLLEGMYRVFFVKPKNKNQLAARELALQAFNIAEIRLYEDCMFGEILVLDIEHATINDIKKFTPTLVAKMFAAYEVFSLRLRAVYIVNSPSYVSVLVTVLKAVLKPKIFSRIRVHQNAEILKEVFSKDKLPKDYGGEGPSLQELNEIMEKKLGQYQERFDEMDRLKVNESLRPTKLDNDEFLGFYGNFKKLEVD